MRHLKKSGNLDLDLAIEHAWAIVCSLKPGCLSRYQLPDGEWSRTSGLRGVDLRAKCPKNNICCSVWQFSQWLPRPMSRRRLWKRSRRTKWRRDKNEAKSNINVNWEWEREGRAGSNSNSNSHSQSQSHSNSQSNQIQTANGRVPRRGKGIAWRWLRDRVNVSHALASAASCKLVWLFVPVWVVSFGCACGCECGWL